MVERKGSLRNKSIVRKSSLSLTPAQAEQRANLRGSFDTAEKRRSQSSLSYSSHGKDGNPDDTYSDYGEINGRSILNHSRLVLEETCCSSSAPSARRSTDDGIGVHATAAAFDPLPPRLPRSRAASSLGPPGPRSPSPALSIAYSPVRIREALEQQQVLQRRKDALEDTAAVLSAARGLGTTTVGPDGKMTTAGEWYDEATLIRVEETYALHAEAMDASGREFAGQLERLHLGAMQDAAEFREFDLATVVSLIEDYTADVRQLVLAHLRCTREREDAFASALHVTAKWAFEKGLSEAMTGKEQWHRDKVASLQASHEAAMRRLRDSSQLELKRALKLQAAQMSRSAAHELADVRGRLESERDALASALQLATVNCNVLTDEVTTLRRDLEESKADAKRLHGWKNKSEKMAQELETLRQERQNTVTLLEAQFATRLLVRDSAAAKVVAEKKKLEAALTQLVGLEGLAAIVNDMPLPEVPLLAEKRPSNSSKASHPEAPASPSPPPPKPLQQAVKKMISEGKLQGLSTKDLGGGSGLRPRAAPVVERSTHKNLLQFLSKVA